VDDRAGVCGAAAKRPPLPEALVQTAGDCPMTFALLHDTATEVQLMLRNDHVSAVEIKKEDQSVTVHLVGGQILHLTREQSKQYVHQIKTHMHLGT
jgi:hypothetical protein